jgi:uncharacterized membrane protein HdeD (DUF308 family)
VGVILLFSGIISLIAYIVFLDEKPEFNHLIILQLVGGGLIIGLGVAYVLKEDRRKQEL